MLLEYYDAARNAAAIVEKDWMGVLKLTGPDRVSWLQSMVTNDVLRLAPGGMCYAAHLTPQGKVVAHMTILMDADAIWLVLERAAIEKLAAAFDKLIIMEDVQVQNVSPEFEILGVLGPKAGDVLESWLGEPLGLDDVNSHRVIPAGRIARSDFGYDVWVSPDAADKVLRAIAASGATAIDHGIWDVLRTEAGLPVYGVDIDDSTTLPEIGERGISYDKGCYIGQEVVAKIKYIGHANRRFVGFVCEGNEPPVLRSAVHAGGKNVGYVTTSLISPGLGKPIALGFVNRASASPGTAVELAGGDKIVPAVVSELPFVR